MKQKTFLPFLSLLAITTITHATQHTLTLTKRQLCDLELILNEGFAPLRGFMNKTDYESVVKNMRLTDGTVWPMPIVLDVNENTASTITTDDQIALKSHDGTHLATLQVESVYKPNKDVEAQCVYGTTDTTHAGVDYLYNKTKNYYIGGTLTQHATPQHWDFTDLRKTPSELKAYFKENGIEQVVAFQTRNPMHRAHQELTLRAAQQINGHLLIHPVVGLTKPGDIDHFTRVKCYKKILNHYPDNNVTMSLLPLSMRMAGPREALWHAIIRKNYGCTHFIVGRDHAGPGTDRNGNNFYGPYDAQDLVKQYTNEIGITMVPFQEMVYVPHDDTYKPINEVTPDTPTLSISGTEVRRRLKTGEEIPAWFSYPNVVEELRKSNPAQNKKGFTLFLTGLSGAGKSTITEALAMKLMELQDRKVTMLDGDILRTYLSSELGFSKEHRSLNVQRAGFVASEITKNGGIALCALIAPYTQDRQCNRDLISNGGDYIEIYVSTPLQTCEDRDVKGLYAKVREGVITNFTGISDPYEAPTNAEITLDTTNLSLEETLTKIIGYLQQNGYIDLP